MKNYLPKTIALAIVMTAVYSCTTEDVPMESSDLISETTEIPDLALFDDPPCFEAFPKSQITNNSNNVVNMEVFDSNDVLLNASYGIAVGDTSEYITFPVGVTTFKISSSQAVKSVIIEMGICMSYEVTINEFNHLNTDIPIQL